MAAIFTRTNLIIFLFIFFFVNNAYSQFDLSGRVEDETTQRPVTNAHVYFNSTTIKTHTDNAGSFVFKNVRLINTDIVVFAPGYEILVFKPSAKNIEGRKVVFRLQPKVPAPEKLEVDAASKKQAIIAFEEMLLGRTQEANDCKVVNENALYFVAGETSTSYKIMCDTTLNIISKRLGYQISYNLVEYNADIVNREQNIVGFVSYSEMGDAHNYIGNRKKVYEASTLHFFRSLVNHQLYQQQFETYWMKPVKDTTVLNSPPSNFFISDTDTALLEPADPRELLFIDNSNELVINLPQKLLVYYAKNPPGKNYMLANGLWQGFAKKGVQSYISSSQPSMGINHNGVLDDYTNIQFGGYWQYELLANKLPLDYDPGN